MSYRIVCRVLSFSCLFLDKFSTNNIQGIAFFLRASYYSKSIFTFTIGRIDLKILLTGCEGLIGSALKVALLNQGIYVQGFDQKLHRAHPDYGDILDLTRLGQVVTNCDGIIHLAAVSRVIWGEKDPDLCWKTNFGGTQNVLERASKSPKHPWVLYASSREVYGNQDVLPVKENAELNPVNIYGRSKASAEEITLKERSNGLNTAIVRFSNVYGSINDHRDRVIPAFCLAASTGQALRVDGSENTFDFTHVKDVVAGLLKIIEKLTQGEQNLTPFHFTTGRATSLREAAKIANMAGGNKSKIIEAPSRSFDVSNFCGDATQTMSLLNWQPTISLEEGISQLLFNFSKDFDTAQKMNTHVIGGHQNENTQSNSRLSSKI
jgi:UDP-glucose 4-epimerase